MPNYDAFIRELLKLELGYNAYCVHNGEIIHDINHPDYTMNKLVSFLSLDYYYEVNFTYTDKLAELQRMAITEIRLLEPAQQNRILADVKEHEVVLIEALVNAEDYKKAWVNNTLLDPEIDFLAHRVYNGFIIPNRLQFNPRPRPYLHFANTLIEVIGWKQKSLSSLIHTIQKGLPKRLIQPFRLAA